MRPQSGRQDRGDRVRHPRHAAGPARADEGRAAAEIRICPGRAAGQEIASADQYIRKRNGANGMIKLVGTALSGILILGAAPALADPVADFYKGKQIRFIVRTLGRRRLRSIHAADRPLHRQIHSRQSGHRGRQHAGRRRHHRRQLHGAGGAARRHRDRHRQPGPRRRSGARRLAGSQGRSARVQLDRQCGPFQPAAGGLAHLADQDAGGRQEPRDHHRHHRRGLGVGAVPGVLQQRARHQVQDRVRLSRRAGHQSRDGARRGRRPRYQSLFRLDGGEADLDSGEEDHPAHSGRHREGARRCRTCR